MENTASYVTQTELLDLAAADEVLQVWIEELPQGGFSVSVAFARRPSHWYYLSVRRERGEPRRFRAADTALAAARSLLGARQATVSLL